MNFIVVVLLFENRLFFIILKTEIRPKLTDLLLSTLFMTEIMHALCNMRARKRYVRQP